MGYWPLRVPLAGTTRKPCGARTKGEARMSEATDRQEMERRLIEKSLEDDAFRQRLIEDPKGAVVETAETIYPVLPSASPAGEMESSPTGS